MFYRPIKLYHISMSDEYKKLKEELMITDPLSREYDDIYKKVCGADLRESEDVVRARRERCDSWVMSGGFAAKVRDIILQSRRRKSAGFRERMAESNRRGSNYLKRER